MPDPQQNQGMTREQAIARLQELYDRGNIPEKYKANYKKLVARGIIDPTRRFGDKAIAQPDNSPFDDLSPQFKRSENAQNPGFLGFLGNAAADIPHTIGDVVTGLVSVPSAVIGSQIRAINAIRQAQAARGEGNYEVALKHLDEARDLNGIPLRMAKSMLGGEGGITTKTGALISLRAQANNPNETPQVRAIAAQQADRLQHEIWQGVLDQSYERPVSQALNVATGVGAALKGPALAKSLAAKSFTRGSGFDQALDASRAALRWEAEADAARAAGRVADANALSAKVKAARRAAYEAQGAIDPVALANQGKARPLTDTLNPSKMVDRFFEKIAPQKTTPTQRSAPVQKTTPSQREMPAQPSTPVDDAFDALVQQYLTPGNRP